MAQIRFTGTKNYLYIGALGAEVDTGALSGSKFFKITAKAAASVFPATSEVGDVIYNNPALTLVSGDKAKPFTLSKLGFVTNVPQSGSKEKFENTTQIDDAKSYEEDDKPELTGNVDGYFTNDAEADLILKRFFRVVDHSGAGVIVYAPTTFGVLHFFLGRHETTTVGATDIMEYMPAIVEGLTVDKPMNGPQTFNFNYTIIGSEKPSIYRRVIPVT
jgi:hypothetical protein